MTLETVSRYDPTRRFEGGDHAVVIGAGMAGLCAARVLADGFTEVTIVERDSLIDEPVTRRGVPQSQHIHVLLEGGRATLEDLFPGFGEELLSAGGVAHDAARDVKFYMEGDFLANGPRRCTVYGATRPLYEQVVREQVAALEGVHFRSNSQFTDYLVTDAATSVTGILVQDEGGETTAITTDLTVDATGRTSRTPRWLDEHGYTRPSVDEVRIDVAYSSTTVERPATDRRGIIVTPSPQLPRGGTFVPVEDGRWVMTLWGMHGDAPPTDPAGFANFAASLPVPDLKRMLDDHPWRTDDIAHYPFPSNLRRRYEDLDRFPEGLIVIGDGVASFNPIYGQGMSVAAFEAAQLQHALVQDSHTNLAPRFFDRIEETVDLAWNLAVGSDHQFPQTEGPKPRGTDFLNWYLSRFLRKAHTDGELWDLFFSVQMMEKPPTALLRPGVVWRVFKP
ncbi:FAD-dependent monooxygenase [Natrialba sp. PRR66]|uniref:NAD(P)/FAD-dependent oxidoreductase n=1 Tax=Natrialba sp. PRR66 TaxID=3098146 RepID=UPI002B1DB85C|nr:FAD-dependent monooxygenase [Natrialba sp. PRR66]